MRNISKWMAAAALLLPVASQAQNPVVPRETPLASPYQRYTTYQISLRYGVFQPVGSLAEYTGDIANRNFAVAGEWVMPRTNLSFGGQFSNQYFSDRLPRQVYRLTSGADISAVQSRSFQVRSLLATAKYHFADVTARLRPYAQVGAGVAFVEYGQYLGNLEADVNNSFRFGTQAALGTRFVFKREGGLGLDAQVAYHYVPYNYGMVSNPSAVGVWVGIFYRWW
jgi:hypothetical protein